MDKTGDGQLSRDDLLHQISQAAPAHGKGASRRLPLLASPKVHPSPGVAPPPGFPPAPRDPGFMPSVAYQYSSPPRRQ